MLKILIVEDNKIPAMTAKAIILQNTDAEVTIASTGEDALKLCDDTIFDVILMDIGLGEGINGAETTKIMRNRESSFNRKRCYISALTAHAAIEDIEYYKSMGIDKTYKKPLTRDILEEILQAQTKT